MADADGQQPRLHAGGRDNQPKTTTLEAAIEEYVPDGASVTFGGMGGRDPDAAAREIIRQDISGLRVIDDARTTLFDMLVGAGAVDEYVGSWVGTSLISQGFNVRRAVEDAVPHHLHMTDVSNFGASLLFFTAAIDVPFIPTRSMLGTTIPEHNDDLATIEDPFGSGDEFILVQAPDIDTAIIHVQHCDERGNAQIYGNVINDHIKARAAEHTIITCEEIVPSTRIRSNPALTRIPFYTVDAVAEVPFGSHPWHVYGYYYADLPFYRDYGLESKERESFLDWLDEWILPHDEYLEKVGADRLARLRELERTLNRVPTEPMP